MANACVFLLCVLSSTGESAKEVWHGKSAIQSLTPNVVVSVEKIDQTVSHGGKPVKLVQAELAFETYADHFSLHAYKLREGMVEGGCRSIRPLDPNRDCFQLYKAQVKVSRVVVFSDANKDGMFDQSDTIQQEASLTHNRGAPTEDRAITDKKIPVHYKQYNQDTLRTEYFVAAAPTTAGGLTLQPDALEAKYTVNVKTQNACTDCMVYFEIDFASKATTEMKAGKAGQPYGGLTFGERNDGYFAWAMTMLGMGSGSEMTLKVTSQSDPGVKTGPAKGAKGTMMFGKKMKFTAPVPDGVTSVSWDPVLGSTEFGAKMMVNGTGPSSPSTTIGSSPSPTTAKTIGTGTSGTIGSRPSTTIGSSLSSTTAKTIGTGTSGTIGSRPSSKTALALRSSNPSSTTTALVYSPSSSGASWIWPSRCLAAWAMLLAMSSW